MKKLSRPMFYAVAFWLFATLGTAFATSTPEGRQLIRSIGIPIETSEETVRPCGIN